MYDYLDISRGAVWGILALGILLFGGIAMLLAGLHSFGYFQGGC